MKPESRCRRRNKYTAICAITMFILGILLLSLNTWLIQLLLSSTLVLKPNSLIESAWKYIPDIQMDIYSFNWTNPEEFHNLSIKPKFEQAGPYRLREDIEKVDVIYNKNGTVTYNLLRHLRLDENSNNTDLLRPLTIVNGIILCLSHFVRHMSYLTKKMVSAYLSTSDTSIHITKTTKQFLFEGFNDFVLEMGNYFPFIHEEIPRFDKFSLFSVVSETRQMDGTFNIASGTDGTFTIRNWNFNNVTPHFNKPCNEIHGSTGEIFPKNLSKDYVDMFIAPLCRHARLDFEEEVLVGGIVGYKYSVGDSMLDNGTTVSGNECYCDGDCIPSGMLNISACRYNFPLYISLPNFYGADPVYLDAIEGLHPAKDNHEAYIIIEPNTGIPLQATARIQLNMLIHSIEDISFEVMPEIVMGALTTSNLIFLSLYEDVREIILPVVWLEERSTLPDHIHLLLKIYLMLPCIITGFGSILIILGVVLISIPYKPMFATWLKKTPPQRQFVLPIPEEIPLRKES